MNSTIKLIPANTDQYRTKAVDLLVENDLPISDLDEGKALFILMQDDEVIGTGGLEFFGDCALLRSVSVSKQVRGRGFGKLISAELENLAKNKRVRRLYLLTTTAKDFFEKEGFAVVDKQEVPESIKGSTEFSSVCPSSAILMVKDIL